MSPPVLFFSKAKDAWECPRKYYWRYKEELVPKDPNTNLERGSYVHAVAHHAIKIVKDPAMATAGRDVALGQALLEQRDKFRISAEIRDDANAMTLELWKKLAAFNIVETEKVLQFEGEGYIWKVKLDAILQDPLDASFWQGEYKSTKSYTSRLKVLYHQGIQPFIYLTVASKCGIQLKGTKMFVASKTDCAVEDVIALDEHFRMAERFIEDSADYILFLERVCAWHQNRTACLTLTSECPYRALCHPHARPEYYTEVKEMMYVREDPLAHLEED